MPAQVTMHFELPVTIHAGTVLEGGYLVTHATFERVGTRKEVVGHLTIVHTGQESEADVLRKRVRELEDLLRDHSVLAASDEGY